MTPFLFKSTAAPILKVALLKEGPLYPLDYLGSLEIQVGMRVRVPLGKRISIGVVIAVANTPDCNLEKLKNILEALDETPLFSAEQLLFFSKVADYYHHPLGAVIAAALPPPCRQGKVLPPLSLIKTPVTSHLAPLNSAQVTAATTIIQTLDRYHPVLLQGVTGSGKTAVYLECITHIFKQQKQALVLVPEIALTPQTQERFENCFGKDHVIVYHSKLTPKQRYQYFRRTLEPTPLVVIGTRSAVLLPLASLGIIIVDEEHDPSYKQQEGFRYSARDLSVWRAQFQGIPLVLGSATPSLETLHLAKRKPWQTVLLSERFYQNPLPQINIIDIRNQDTKLGFSAPTHKLVQQTLEKDGQVLFFLNRRGFAPVWMCFECQYRMPCPFCSTYLTYHQHPTSLRCHHCGYLQPLQSECPDCKHTLSPVGIGTQRLEQQLMATFPDVPLLRLDSDTIRPKGQLEHLLSLAHTPGAKILLGTQLLAKGHNFPHLQLAVLLETDQALFSSDFRATERFGQIITQVSGRTGRFETPGSVVIETQFPNHPLLVCLSQQGYPAFAESLALERKKAGLPPFQYLALLRADSIHSQQAETFLKTLKTRIIPPSGAHLLGPVAAPIFKKSRHYRWQMLLQAEKRSLIREVIHQIDAHLGKVPRTVKFSIDIDPIDLY